MALGFGAPAGIGAFLFFMMTCGVGYDSYPR